VLDSGGDAEGGAEGSQGSAAAVFTRRLDHSKPAGEQDPWRCAYVGSVARCLTLQLAITQRAGMEAGVFSLSAMNERQLARCREEASKSSLLFAPSAPLGGDGRGA
jgi:hypothetical protein